MTRLRFAISMSLDGYVAGRNQSMEHPLGEGGEGLHEWAVATRSWRAAHGHEGGETGIDDERIARSATGVGAHIMGRNMFGPVRGPWDGHEWKGWWGDEPPFHTHVFVLTHHAREPVRLQGGTTFHFVTEGIEAALERAADAAGDLDVAVGGGASAVQQYLRAGLVDEFEIHVVPLLLGGGARLFEDLGGGPEGYECVALESSPAAAHFSFVRAGRA
jgi:dihydrofolate reductase